MLISRRVFLNSRYSLDSIALFYGGDAKFIESADKERPFASVGMLGHFAGMTSHDCLEFSFPLAKVDENCFAAARTGFHSVKLC